MTEIDTFSPLTDCDPRTSETGHCMSVIDEDGGYCQEECRDKLVLRTLAEIGITNEGLSPGAVVEISTALTRDLQPGDTLDG